MPEFFNRWELEKHFLQAPTQQAMIWIKNACSLLPAMIIGLFILSIDRTTAQIFTTLHNLAYGSDGASPQGSLVLSSNTLYGTAGIGGTAGAGTLFAMNIDGTGFTNLHNFNEANPNALGYYTNNGGAYPLNRLILSARTLFGMTREGGSAGVGTIFRINTDGSGFANLHIFSAPNNNLPRTNSDGAYPRASLLLSGSTLYGTAVEGGTSGAGTIFAVQTNGTGFIVLHSFSVSDGARPAGDLILISNVLYGAACQGGDAGNGVVFALQIDGKGFTNLHSFGACDASGINSEGSTPLGGLTLSGNLLYGTAVKGGASGNGTVFKINTDGTGLMTVHHFESSDGVAPVAGVALSGSTLYGTAGAGGTSGAGTLFRVNVDGTGFENLYNFTAVSGAFNTNSDGANPQAGLILLGSTLYGTAVSGGDTGHGTLFSILLQPKLTIMRSQQNVVLMWPTTATGFTLQSSTNVLPASDWATVSPSPVVNGGQNCVTNSISGVRRFYRLAQ